MAAARLMRRTGARSVRLADVAVLRQLLRVCPAFWCNENTGSLWAFSWCYSSCRGLATLAMVFSRCRC